MMITSSLIVQLPDYHLLLSSKKDVLKLEPFEILVLFFYIEQSKNSESSWYPYISMLPKEFTTPLALKIDPQTLPSQPRQLFEKQISEVETISSHLRQFIPDLDYSLFLWSWHVVNTRCIYYDNNSNTSELVDTSQGDSLAVIPLMDMMNHSVDAQCSPGFDKYSQKYRVTTADRLVRNDEQLFVTYGQHDNGKL